MKWILAFVVIVALASASYPLYKQCDKQWGSEILGRGPATVCRAGCAMSSLAMALAGHGKKVGGAVPTPKTLNSWLKSNGGFSGELLMWGAVSKVGLKYVGKINRASVPANFDAGKIVILNVRNGGHWVLMTGRSGATFHVNDPGFSVSSYPQSGVTEAAVYTVSKSFLQEAFENFKNIDQSTEQDINDFEIEENNEIPLNDDQDISFDDNHETEVENSRDEFEV